MHFLLEVIMPPSAANNVEQALEDALAPYYEGYEDEDGITNPHAFYDYYVVGGRWSGEKLKARLGKEKINQFYEWCNTEGITVSGLQFGKPELHPVSQMSKVDAKWREMFPNSGAQCVLFKHSGEDALDSDICTLANIPYELEACRVIFLKQHWKDESRLEVGYMLSDEHWNGTNHEKAAWSGSVNGAIASYRDYVNGRYKEEHIQKYYPQDDWVSVTVDYHS